MSRGPPLLSREVRSVQMSAKRSLPFTRSTTDKSFPLLNTAAGLVYFVPRLYGFIIQLLVQAYVEIGRLGQILRYFLAFWHDHRIPGMRGADN